MKKTLLRVASLVMMLTMIVTALVIPNVESKAADTVTIHVNAPSEWTTKYAHYWGATGTSWPGVELTTAETDGWYKVEVPVGTTGFIVHNNSGAQTADITLTSGVETWIAVNKDKQYNISTTGRVNAPGVEAPIKVHVKVNQWEAMAVYGFDGSGSATTNSWAGNLLSNAVDGWYTTTVPATTAKLIVNNNGKGLQTADIVVPDNATELWIAVNEDKEYNISTTGKVDAPSVETPITVHVKKNQWEAMAVYGFNATGATSQPWAGNLLSNAVDGWYTTTVPAATTTLIVNNNGNGLQTGDITIPANTTELWIAVNEEKDYNISTTGKVDAPVIETPIKVYVKDNNWDKQYVYGYNDSGDTTAKWPGVELKDAVSGWFEIEVPSSTTDIIINDGKDSMKTGNISVSGKTQIYVAVNEEGADNHSYTEQVEAPALSTPIKLHIQANDYTKVFAYAYTADDKYVSQPWPGIELSGKDSEGWYTVTISGITKNVIINNGEDGDTKLETKAIEVAGKTELWIAVGFKNGVAISAEGKVEAPKEELPPIKVYVKKNDWDKQYVYFWGGEDKLDYPGIELKDAVDGWFVVEIPADATKFTVNNGTTGDAEKKTADIAVPAGTEAWVAVNANGEYNISTSTKVEAPEIKIEKPADTQKPGTSTPSKPKYEKKYSSAVVVGDFSALKNCNIEGVWDVANVKNNMTYLGNGVYQFVLTFDKTDKDITIEYKIAFDNKWDHSIGLKSVNTDFQDGGANNNVKLVIPAGSTTATLIASEKDWVVYDSFSAPEKINEYVKISKMGDTTAYALYVMMLMAGCGLVAVAAMQKKKAR